MPSVRNTPSWPVGLTIRPCTDPDAADVEVADSVSGRRFRWTPESLSKYILQGGKNGSRLRGHHGKWHEVLRSSTDRTDLLPGWRHWEEHGWHPSDHYYVASRRWAYHDTHDNDESVRTRAIQRYLSVDGPPPEEEGREGPRLSLGVPADPGTQSISRLLVTRRTGRAYVSKPVPLDRLSGLLWYGLAELRKRRDATDAGRPMSYLDSYGSAWDFYVCVYNVETVDPGIYRYELQSHELTSVRPGDHREAMIDALQGMRSPATAAWTLGLIADFPRYQWRYRHEHGLRRLYLEAGILGQELLILGMSYGLCTLVTPAQKDRPYLDLHGLPHDRYSPVYTLTMGLSLGKAGVDFNNGSPSQHHSDTS